MECARELLEDRECWIRRYEWDPRREFVVFRIGTEVVSESGHAREDLLQGTVIDCCMCLSRVIRRIEREEERQTKLKKMRVKMRTTRRAKNHETLHELVSLSSVVTSIFLYFSLLFALHSR